MLLISVPLAGNGTNGQSAGALGALRSQVMPATFGKVPGVSYAVGGLTAVDHDTSAQLGSTDPLVFAFVLGFAFLLLMIAFRSVAIPALSICLNLLSVGAAYGLMTWIFQDGHLTSVLDATARPMDTSMTVLSLCLAFGLSMDYEVFLTSRIKEMHDQGADTPTAVVQGLARTGRIVSTAAGLLSVSFFAFGTSSVSFLQMLGLGAGLAVLLDATLIRGVLVPAVTALFGERIWYAPGWLQRVHRRIGLSDEPVTTEADTRYSQLAHADNG